MKCSYCLDAALVPVLGSDGSYNEAFGPCPKCEAGHLLEFPAPNAKGKQKPGPWGSEGFWQGKSRTFLEPQANAPLPFSENKQRMAALAKSLGVVAKEMP